MTTIGDRIKSRREELGLTQDDLALKLGYKSRSSINKIEKDGRNLPQKKILDIALALDTTVAYIMGWHEPKVLYSIKDFPYPDSELKEKEEFYELIHQQSIDEFNNSPSGQLLALFSQLTPENKEDVMDYIEMKLTKQQKKAEEKDGALG